MVNRSRRKKPVGKVKNLVVPNNLSLFMDNKIKNWKMKNLKII